MSTLKYLLEKEFRQIFRNTVILRMITALPVIQLLVIPLAADYEVKNIHIAIVDRDHSGYSRDLISRVAASGYFIPVACGDTYEDAFRQLERDRADVVLEIPRRFGRDFVREQSGRLSVSINAINGAKGAQAGVYLNRIIAGFNEDIKAEWQLPVRGEAGAGIRVMVTNWYNDWMNYRLFMVPAILVVLVTMVGVYMCALNIVKEKEAGTIEQINVTPVGKLAFIAGKLIPFWVIGMFVFSLGLFLVARLVYGIVPLGSIGLIYGYLGLYLTAVLGIGLLISTYTATQQQAMSLAFFIMMVFLLMSGLFTPVESMPGWARGLAWCSPVTWFIEVMRMVVLKGSHFSDIRLHVVVTAAFALFFNAWAVLNYRKVKT